MRRLLRARSLWLVARLAWLPRVTAELMGYALLVVAAYLVHPIAGIVAGGLVCLNYGLGGRR